MHPIIEKIFGDQNKRQLKQLRQEVEKINAFEPVLQKLSDEKLAQKTREFRDKLHKDTTLEEIKHEAFAVVREAARRTLGQRHYDVQLMGGLVLHSGGISEMKTGEGKTLAATTATYLNTLEGKSVHVVTVNDYLARRDADWMGQIYHFLGLQVSCIQHEAAYCYDANIEEVKRQEGENSEEYEALIVADMKHLRAISRREAYAADIVFGTNNEFGFDYLRDNMVLNKEEMVQRELYFAIVDEVDSILIDEARTPLIISAPAEEATEQYYRFAQLVEALKDGEDYTVDEKMRAATLTSTGITKLEKALGVENIYVASGLRDVHHIEQALKAKTLFQRDKDYVVKDNEVIIIDEFTGRMMPGRRYSEGLHQAIEAKERLPIKKESRTLATITLQNYFRLYKKLSGMTGTAVTEEEEFFKIYGLGVVSIPTHREMIRADMSDRVYKNSEAKYRAVVEKVKELHAKGQPVLLGTISIEHNEILSELLTANGLPHNVLNAKHHEREAEIIAQAGQLEAVTVATNMAGRGVDIILGGNPPDIEEARKVRELGGLVIIGTERHEARRIDNQLRGRSGRQGDPGTSQFYVSLDDDLMRIFGSERMKNFMNRLGVPDDLPIENKMVSRSIEAAQKKVESHHFDIRKHLVEYDDVMNKHREVIYRKRRKFLEAPADEIKKILFELIEDEIEGVISFHTSDEDLEHWDMGKVCEVMKTLLPLSKEEEEKGCVLPNKGQSKLADAQSRTVIIEFFINSAQKRFQQMEEEIGDPELVTSAVRGFILRVIDILWVEHLDQMAFLRESIGLRGYGQRDPLVEYKHESFQMFQQLLANIQKRVAYNIFKLSMAAQFSAPAVTQRQNYLAPQKEMQEGVNPLGIEGGKGAVVTRQNKQNIAKLQPAVSGKRDNSGKKIGRNELCPCGSGKKYKKCHGK